MSRRILLGLAPALACAALLLVPAASQAQRRGGGYGGGWSGGYRSGGWGGYDGGYRNYYPGYSWGWGGYSSPYYSSYYYPGYSSYNYYPDYANYDSGSYYYPSTSYYYTLPYYSTYLSADQPRTGGYQSFYPSEDGKQRASIHVQVPSNAELIFDGQESKATQQRGNDRSFVTTPLEPNQNYFYEVRAKWMENGQPVERTKRVNVRAGEETNVSFMGAGEPTESTAPDQKPSATVPTTPPRTPPATVPDTPRTPRPPVNRPENPQTETPAAPPVTRPPR